MTDPTRERDVRNLNIIVAAQIDGGEVHERRASIPIPPDYDAADVRALTVRAIEDTAFDLNRQDFGRAPTIQALVAAAARLKAIQEILDGPDGIVPRELRIRAVLALSNAEVTEAHGDDPEGA
jgi:hypothetical protein